MSLALLTRPATAASAASRAAAALRRGPPPPRPLAAAARRPPAAARAMASRGDCEKSWAEIGGEAAALARDLASKLKTGVAKAVEAVTSAVAPAEEEEAAAARRREPSAPRRAEPDDGPSAALGRQLGRELGGGLLARAVGKAVGGVVSGMARQLREAAEESSAVQERVAAAVEGDARVRRALGGAARVLPPVSQSSATTVVNGRRRARVDLTLPVVGPRGDQAQARARYVKGDGGGGAEELVISVRLPDGSTIEPSGGDGRGGGGGGWGGAGAVIDVEARSIDD
jgi:hypothetical protein